MKQLYEQMINSVAVLPCHYIYIECIFLSNFYIFLEEMMVIWIEYTKHVHLNASFLTNDYDARSTLRTSYSVEPTPPTPFHDMVNVHQICLWLCANPDILLLSYNLYLSMQTPVANQFNLISPNFNSSTLATGVQKQEDKVNITIINFIISFC